MAARKKRPGKFGTKPLTFPSNALLTWKEQDLLERLRRQRDASGNPQDYLYVGWPDMATANALRKKGWLVESSQATGCFYIKEVA